METTVFDATFDPNLKIKQKLQPQVTTEIPDTTIDQLAAGRLLSHMVESNPSLTELDLRSTGLFER